MEKENDSESGNIEDELQDIDSKMDMLKNRIDQIDKKIAINGGKNQGWSN